MEADDADAVNARLRSQQLTPTKVKKKARAFSLTIGTGVSAKDLVTFTRLFATMIDAGLPIVQCLEILQGQTDNKSFANVLRDVKANVEQGSTFSDSLRRHPKVFDALYVNLVQAGEVGGILDTILNRLAVYNEKAAKLRRQVRGAMVYPSAVVLIFSRVMGILLGWVIPSFKHDLQGPREQGRSAGADEHRHRRQRDLRRQPPAVRPRRRSASSSCRSPPTGARAARNSCTA